MYMCIQSTSTENIINKTFSKEKNKILYKQEINKALKDIQIKFTKAMKSKKFMVKEKCIQKTNLRKNDLKLTIILSGYGSMKNKWKKFLILSGLGEGIVQGIVVNSATHNPWLGLGVAVEEITSEYLSWNGVDWFLGETFAPVTLEGELIYKDKIIWKDAFFVTENNDELNPKYKKIKSKQLMASLHKAENKLLKSLNSYMSKQILKKHNEYEERNKLP